MSVPTSPSFVKVADSAGQLIGDYLTKNFELTKSITDVKKTSRLLSKNIKENII